MSNKMLIDASHPEETRVVVVRGNRIEEFDFESEHKKQLKGNIYLARVTRVEPSLQAAFVEYGGNRHGFLAFSEIHPDYYQIPVADRLALLEAEEKAAKAEQDDDEKNDRDDKKRRSKRSKKVKNSDKEAKAESAEVDSLAEDIEFDDDAHHEDGEDGEDAVELVGAEDALEEVPDRRRIQRKEYQIQEVIKRRQVLLVQVVKEERGNKGAALTTYLSLAGRYSVLMPNTARGGGISRKITNPQDRKRLKEVVKSLDVPKGMGVILRTAGANRTKVEIKRDYEYLMRLWDNVRNLTLESSAPALVYEEGSLIKRSIRDLYNKDIGEILVSGDNGYREAKDFMRMLMPSHAKVVQPYRDQLPIFARNGIETQLDKMLQPQVTLKSGGYLVINQTEALVAIDVNSGRSTKEHSVEETAVQTNLEAAEEVARQLRLRDLAGLVVIDFIDMEEKRNIRHVEKRLKDCLKDDRARIQVGRISHFGLMEMSRQRIRASVLESTMQPCPHCAGTGHVRSDSSMSLHIIRTIEEYLLRNPGHNIIARTSVSSAVHVLNHKRNVLSDLEARFGLTISIEADDTVGSQQIAIYKGEVSEGAIQHIPVPSLPVIELEEEDDIEIAATEEIENDELGDERGRRRRRRNRRGREQDNDNRPDREETDEQLRADSTEEERRRRRRRGRRGGRRNRDNEFERRRIPYAEPVGPFAERALAEIREARRQRRVPQAEPVGSLAEKFGAVKSSPYKQNNMARDKKRQDQHRSNKRQDVTVETSSEAVVTSESPVKNKKRSRKKIEITEPVVELVETPVETIETPAAEVIEAVVVDEKPKRGRKKKVETAKVITIEITGAETANSTILDTPQSEEKKPRRSRRKVAANDASVVSSKPVVTSSEETEEKPKKAGWWQRKGFF